MMLILAILTLLGALRSRRRAATAAPGEISREGALR